MNKNFKHKALKNRVEDTRKFFVHTFIMGYNKFVTNEHTSRRENANFLKFVRKTLDDKRKQELMNMATSTSKEGSGSLLSKLFG